MPSAAQGKVDQESLCVPFSQSLAVCVLMLMSANAMLGSSVLWITRYFVSI